MTPTAGLGNGDGLPLGLTLSERSHRTSAFRALLEAKAPLVVPGATDALMARLVELAGFPLCYATGAGIANMAWGLPDIGLTAMPDVVQNVSRIAASVSIPVLADGDDGYGGPLSVMRTVAAMEAAGAAGIQFEDQAAPKRCGHFDGKELIRAEEMVAKLIAARSAVTGGTVIVARTDAVAIEGFEPAIERARLYQRAGADVLFIEAPDSVEQLRAIPQLLPGIPLVANIVPGGKTPPITFEELEALGYTLVLHANLLMRVMIRAGQSALARLHETGDYPADESMISWDERQDLVGLSRFADLEDRLRLEAARLVDRA